MVGVFKFGRMVIFPSELPRHPRGGNAPSCCDMFGGLVWCALTFCLTCGVLRLWFCLFLLARPRGGECVASVRFLCP